MDLLQKEFDANQKTLNKLYCELNKRIDEHDHAPALGFEKPEITIQVGIETLGRILGFFSMIMMFLFSIIVRYSARRQVSHDSRAYHGVIGHYWGGYPLPSSAFCLGVSQPCNYTSLNRETVQQKYRNRVSERSFSPLSTNVSAIFVQL